MHTYSHTLSFANSTHAGDLSNESLKLLSSQQALADAAQFRQYMFVWFCSSLGGQALLGLPC